MFFIASKILYWLIMPINMIVLLLLASLVVKQSKAKKLLRYAGIGLLLFFSNPLIARWTMNLWEPDAVPYNALSSDYDWGIVLAGITEPNRPPFDRVHFNKGADRIIHAIEMYKLGKVKKILVSGGSGILTFEGKKESHALRDFALLCGVKPEDVQIEDQSRNTHENALFSQKALGNQTHCILFTSAFHTKRAASCFEKTGMPVDIFPTDYYGGPLQATPDDLLIPKLYSLQLWSILIKEWVGLVTYKIVGYI
ncbi:YdcF family protein [Reichenbachiella agarivorans]|uniref:YdcF family protein n=1 Tax=Reichenbachiella agarivorans TaxID=2979464 RepID=A0ABY6CKM6_9BACT|nr:YdcF family protein [Reichenbachiella agarivorans]UXP31070.1 YdcF family protein [Reichenbachiella agarivorans]